jgi:uncharacterized protein YggE
VLGAAALLAVMGLARVAPAQPSAPVPPQIVVTATGELEAAPDRATVMLGVETEAETAAAAASRNATTQRAVLAALRAAGIPAARIRTTGYSVAPKQRYDQPTRRTITDGYVVRNLVVVDVDDIDRVGPVIDAALGAGANRVAGLTFALRDEAAARETALTRAVERARRDAEIAARAAGGSLGGLIELTIQGEFRPMMRTAAVAEMAMASDATPVEAGTTTVQVTVSTRWEFRQGAP